MTDVALRHRVACRADTPALTALMEAAIGELQQPFLDPAHRGQPWAHGARHAD